MDDKKQQLQAIDEARRLYGEKTTLTTILEIMDLKDPLFRDIALKITAYEYSEAIDRLEELQRLAPKKRQRTKAGQYYRMLFITAFKAIDNMCKGSPESEQALKHGRLDLFLTITKN